MRRHLAWGLVLGGLLLAPQSMAAEDPAFPAPVALMNADEEPIVALNVGLLVKRSDGSDWSLSCSPDPSGDVLAYRSDPVAPNTILAVLHTGVAVTKDLGCTWTRYDLPHGQLLDAGFDGEHVNRVWLLINVPGALTIEIGDAEGRGPRQTLLLPPDLEIESAVNAGVGPNRRFYVSAFDSITRTPYLIQADLETGHWVRRAIAESTFERPRIVNASKSGELAVRLMGSVSDRLALTSDGSTFSFSPSLGGFARAVWRDGIDRFLLAVRLPDEHRLLRLAADGSVVGSTPMPFAARAIDGQPDRLFALAYALDGSPPILQSRDFGDTWSPLFRLFDVHARRDCPTRNPLCEAGCLQLFVAGLLPREACGSLATDGGQDAATPAAPEGPSGCAVGTPTPQASRTWSVIALILCRRITSRHAKKKVLAMQR